MLGKMSGDSLLVRIKITRDVGSEWRDLILKGKLSGPMGHREWGCSLYQFDLYAPLSLIRGVEVDADLNDMLIERRALKAIFTSDPASYHPTVPRAADYVKG